MSSKLITDFYYSDKPLEAGGNRHKHNVHQMIYIIRGSMVCEIAGNKMTCAAPALVFIGNYEPHMILETSGDYARYVLAIDPYEAGREICPELLQSVLSFHPAGFLHVLDVSSIAEEIKVLFSILYRERQASDRLAEGEGVLLSALLYQLWRKFPEQFVTQKYGTAERIVAAVRMELECNFIQKLNLDALAEQHHISRYYLTHIFRQVTGYSLKEYLMLCRISYACHQLEENVRNIGEIAENSGFRDMSNFSRAFKERIGMSPTEFRKKFGGNREAG